MTVTYVKCYQVTGMDCGSIIKCENFLSKIAALRYAASLKKHHRITDITVQDYYTRETLFYRGFMGNGKWIKG